MRKILTHANYHIYWPTWICIPSLLLSQMDCLCYQYQLFHLYTNWIYSFLLTQGYSFRNSTFLSYIISFPYASG